ncbi:MAG: SMI1/KNR4 family protein [Solibacillus sp.]
MERLVEKTITALRERLASQGTLLIQQEEGFVCHATCTFNPPATDEEITQLEQQIGRQLPADYRAFLKLTNGCRLFGDVHSGGEAYVYSVEQLCDYNEQEDLSIGRFAVAYIYQDEIVMDREGLYWRGHIDSFSNAVPLRMSFEEWLDRFVVCQGVKFWLW